MPPDPWYAEVGGDELSQGDLIRDCPIILPLPATAREHKSQDFAENKVKNVGSRPPIESAFVQRVCHIVVMTQSCDLANQKAALVLVCPHYSLEELYLRIAKDEANRGKSSEDLLGSLRSTVQNIRAGKTAGRYMLPSCSLKRWNQGIRESGRWIFNRRHPCLTNSSGRSPVDTGDVFGKSPLRDILPPGLCNIFHARGVGRGCFQRSYCRRK